MIEIISYPIIFIFLWLTSFIMWHEFSHIKSQGLLSTGTIGIEKFSAWAGVNKMVNSTLFWYGGGILSGLIFYLMILMSTGWWQWCFLTIGTVQICYGIYEGIVKANNIIWQRYLIYIVVTALFIIIWMVK